MSKPHRCPHIATTGNICVYCPGGPDSDFEYSTQSYTGYEPTSMRAIWAGMAFSSSLTHFIEHLIGNSKFIYNPYVQARRSAEEIGSQCRQGLEISMIE
ncbi:hypothetical protein DVH24_008588 [Malus domestica]|uniref:Uncharacterized protein n=1 Tax=Malus domestica TaxID=3750 RepID=A0A498JK31_MALDO|nr:hypothetical protein DVH24_008588 [Malus domestica]